MAAMHAPSTPQHSRHANNHLAASSSHSSNTLSPHTPRPSASSPSVSTPSSSRPSQSVDIDTLLASHAKAADPVRSALEHVVADRNAVAAQNAQLWKLIEKQRSTTSQLNKDNDRIRGEREAYKLKLQAMGENTDSILKSFKEKEKERHGKSSGSAHRSNSSPNPKTTLQRHHSDEPGSGNLRTGTTETSRPNPTVVTSQQSSHSTSEPHHQHTSRTAPPTYPSERTTSKSSSHVPRQHTRTAKQPATQDQHVLSSSPDQMLEESDEIEVEPSSATTSPTAETPASSLYALTASTTPVSSHEQAASAQTLLEITTAHLPPPVHSLSRESRISLPPEVKQYMAAMGESPLPSPKLPAVYESSSSIDHASVADHHRMESPARSFATTYSASNANSASNLDVNHPYDHQGRYDSPRRGREPSDNEFLDMEEGEDDGDDDDQDSLTDPRGRRAVHPSADSNHASGLHNHGNEVSPGPQPSTEDFPMPPATTVSDASDATTAYSQPVPHQQVVTVAADNIVDGPRTPTANSYNVQGQGLHSPGTPVNSNGTSNGTQPSLFRALPLLPSDLPVTRIQVTSSSVRPNERGKDVLSFVVRVEPQGANGMSGSKGKGKEGWSIEKMYSDVLGLDQRVRARVGKSIGKRIANLPDGKLWRDHAPSKVDQRKAVLEQYLQTLINLPVKNNDEVIAFLTSDIIKETNKPISREGYKEGYLTKRGKNFGGWKTRFFVLQGPQLEYYESRGGTHLGTIQITGAQIGRQQRPTDRPQTDEENEYRHAFLIIEGRRGSSGQSRHVLCAESDAERDSWVEILVRYISGVYDEDPVSNSSSGASVNSNVPSNSGSSTASMHSRTSADGPESPVLMRNGRQQPVRGMSKDDISVGPAVPLSQLPHDPVNAKLFQNAVQYDDASQGGSSVKGNDASPSERHPTPPSGFTDQQTARRLLDRNASPSQPQTQPSSSQSGSATDLPLSSSLPTTSPLESGTTEFVSPRANSELGHYSDMADSRTALAPGVGGAGAALHSRQPPASSDMGWNRHQDRKSYLPTHDPVRSSPHYAQPPQGQSNAHLTATPTTERSTTPDSGNSAQSTPRPEMVNNSKVKISGPMNGAPIPAGLKFGGAKEKEAEAHPPSERREKAKSRMFWDRFKGEKPPTVTHIPRNVFGVPLEESLDVSSMAGLPSIVFRCIDFLEKKHAELEEGIYRLSGSSAVIKSLKDRFNTEGDVDLLGSDEYWDPHAIAGLLKSFFRELPVSVLTRDLHHRFLAVIDLVDPKDRVRELSGLVQQLPVPNYSLLRALAAHLILIVQNANTNKMTMRNVGIVFSPTLGIPAGVFSLMLADFSRVFNVNDEEPTEFAMDENGNGQFRAVENSQQDEVKRNSRQYADAAADQLLGLSGRSLKAPEEAQSDDGEEISIHDESGAETTDTDQADAYGGSTSHSQSPSPDTLTKSRLSSVAATRGLNINVTGTDTRRHSHSRPPGGLPASPRPTGSPLNPRSAGLSVGGPSSSQQSPSSSALLTPR